MDAVRRIAVMERSHKLLASPACVGLQGLPRASVAAQAGELLESVKLTAAASVRTEAYSGGMRRRLR